MDECRNSLLLCGRASGEPVFSHSNHGEGFHRFPLSVERLSQQEDCLSVLATESQFASLLPLTGRKLRVEGQIRSFNNKSGEGSRLVISVLARTLQPSEEEDCNCVTLTGVICKPPILRRTPLGRCICDVMLAVNRRYGRADYLPCIAWGQVAILVGQMPVGSPLSIDGRIQSRRYTKVLPDRTELRTAYEVSIMQLREPADAGPD